MFSIKLTAICIYIYTYTSGPKHRDSNPKNATSCRDALQNPVILDGHHERCHAERVERPKDKRHQKTMTEPYLFRCEDTITRCVARVSSCNGRPVGGYRREVRLNRIDDLSGFHVHEEVVFSCVSISSAIFCWPATHHNTYVSAAACMDHPNQHPGTDSSPRSTVARQRPDRVECRPSDCRRSR